MEYLFNKALGAVASGEWYVKLITDAASEPLSLADEIIHSKINLGSPADADEQTYIESLFPAARKAVEAIIHRPIGTQEFELGLSRFPLLWVLEFPKAPLISIKTIKYTKDDGTVITWYDSTASPVVDPAMFVVETGCEPGALFMKSQQAWPSDLLMYGFPVKIRFTAGIDPVPENLLQALRYCFGHFYDNREPVTDGRLNQPFEVPKTLDWLCEPYRYDVYA
jgi:uncharacterized phiE125 gp8 family phage protein